MAKSIDFAVAVKLSEQEANAIAANTNYQGALHDKLGQVGSALMRDFSRGGIMIPPDYASRIRSAINTDSPSIITEHVEESVNKQGEATIVKWVVDPTQIQFYQHLALNAGKTLEQQLKSIMDYAYSQGWFGMGATEVFQLQFTAEQHQWLQKLFGKDIVLGDDVLQKLYQAAGGVTATDENDLVMESLREK